MNSIEEALPVLQGGNSQEEIPYELPEGYEFRGKSLYGPNKEGELVQLTAETSILILAHMRTPDQNGWSALCEMVDLSGTRKCFALPHSSLVGGGAIAIRELADRGLMICPGAQKAIIAYLMMSKPNRRMLRAINSGWVEGMLVFVLPHQVIGYKCGEELIYEPEMRTNIPNSIIAGGSLDEWRDNIASHISGNLLLVFGVLAALSGPLLKLVGLDGGGWHVYGHSSRGKTSLLQMIASVWGVGSDPAVDANSYAKRWNLTANAIEALAASFSDMVICLDELGTYMGTDLGRDVYALAGGQGKAAMNSQRNLRTIRTWRGNIFSTGEKSFHEAIEQSGKQVKAGQMLRIVDIHIDNILPSPPDSLTPGKFANLLKQNCSTYYGTAGPAMVQGLVDSLEEDYEGTLESLRETLDLYTQELTPEGSSPEQGRVFRRLAALQIAGEAAIHFEILPLEIEEVRKSVEHVRDLWLAENRTIDDTDRALQRLQSYLVCHHASFAAVRDKNARSGNVRAFCNNAQNLYLFTDEQLTAAIGGGSLKEVIQELRRKNLLVANEPGRLKIKQKLASADDRWVRFYALKSEIIEADLDSRNLDAASQDQPELAEESEITE